MASVEVAQPRRARRKRLRNNPVGYLFIAPAILLYAGFNIYPIVRGLLMAFTNYQFIYPGTRWSFNGLSNFREMFHDPDFWQSVRVSLKYAVLAMPATVIFSFLIALGINRLRRGNSFYRWTVYLPAVLPTAVAYLMFQDMYDNKFGFFNSLLQGWGIHNPPDWLGSTTWALPALVAANVWAAIGLPTLLFLIGMYGIDPAIYEAAALDGASFWRQVRHVTLPLLKPMITLVIVLSLTVIPVVTDPMLILTQGNPENTTRSLGLYIYQTAFQNGNLRLGYSAAMNLAVGVVSALLALLVFRVLREKH